MTVEAGNEESGTDGTKPFSVTFCLLLRDISNLLREVFSNGNRGKKKEKRTGCHIGIKPKQYSKPQNILMCHYEIVLVV
ncbi:hypothetical protein STEG23_029701 [Scotinomys teguina]